jgi:transglutaminase-like putative cysteine protease
MMYRIIHNTTYHYSASAESCHNVVRLHPRLILANPRGRESLAGETDPSSTAFSGQGPPTPSRGGSAGVSPSQVLQTCRDIKLAVDPAPASLHSYDDYFGNRVHSFAIYQPHLTLSITAESQVSVEPRPGLDLTATMPWQEAAEWLHGEGSPAKVEALEHVFDSP